MVIRGHNRRKDSYAKEQETAGNLKLKKNRSEIADMLLRGCSADYIQLKMGIGEKTYNNIVKDLNALWAANAETAFAEVKARELARIDHLRAVAWEAWENSRKGERVDNSKVTQALRMVRDQSTKTVPQGEKRAKKEEIAVFKMETVGKTKTRNTRSSAGDVGFLNIVKWCMEMMFKVYGVGQPNVTNNNLFVGGDPAASMTVDWDAIARDISDHKEEIEALPPFNPDMQVAQVIPEGEEV